MKYIVFVLLQIQLYKKKKIGKTWHSGLFMSNTASKPLGTVVADSLFFCQSLLLFSASLWLRDFLLPAGTGVPQASASGSLLYGTFWTVWERSTLLSRAVKQLTQLLVQASIEVKHYGSYALSFSWGQMVLNTYS